MSNIQPAPQRSLAAETAGEYHAALAAVREALAHEALVPGYPDQARQKAWQAYQETIERDLLAPILEEAADASSPAQTMLGIALVEVARGFFAQTAQASATIQHHLGSGVRINASTLQPVLEAADRITTLVRELRRNRPLSHPRIVKAASQRLP